MLSTIALVVAGLSTGHKIGLVAVAAAFIAFALVSSFVIPRRSPNFPGRAMPVYVTVAVLFFVAMMAAVLVFGKESESSASESPAATSTQSKPLPAQGPVTTAKAAPAPPATTTASSATQGDPAAGKTVFASAGCAGCHTLKDAGATGNVGPNLDQLKPAEAIVVHQVTNGGGAMPAFKGQLSSKQIQDVAAYVAQATHS